MRAFVIAGFCFLFLTAPSARAQVPESLRAAISRIDTATAAQQAKDNLGSVTIGVVSGAKLVWTKSYGLADMEKNTPATQDTVYRIGSITKWLTGLMLLQLVQDGKVNFSDPVEKYFPQVNNVQNRFASAPPITLGQLATMRSGLAREPANLATFMKGQVPDWEKVLNAALAQSKYEFEPDSRYSYSNIGYATLGATLGRAAGMPYVAFVHERILTPLEMNHTAFEPNPTIRPHIATGYQVTSDGKVNIEVPLREHEGRGYKVPNGALYSTVGDLARFLSFELGEGPATVLKKEVLEDAFEHLILTSGRQNSGYGVGMQLTRRGDFVSFGHDGAVAGYVAHVRIDRTSKTGVIALRNVGGGKFDLRGLVFHALAELEKK